MQVHYPRLGAEDHVGHSTRPWIADRGEPVSHVEAFQRFDVPVDGGEEELAEAVRVRTSEQGAKESSAQSRSRRAT